MRNFEICDLHGHFLPGMDDGSASVSESISMLELAAGQGVRQMFATPHYYSVETVDQFLSRRAQSMELLQQAMAGSQDRLPRILPGAEVCYRPGIGNAESLEKLCLGNSKYILLELPFEPWNPGLFRDISSIANVRGLIPVIAHVERYLHMQEKKYIRRLFEQDVVFQMNASALLRWPSRLAAKGLVQSGNVHLLGSDCHNMTTRKPNMGPAMDYLQKAKMEQFLREAADFSMEIFEQAQ